MTAAVKKRILSATPCVGIALPVVRKRPKPYMEDDHLDGLGDTLDPRYWAMAEFDRETGLRPGELCGLHANRVDLKTGWVEVVEVYVSRQKVIRPWPKDEDTRRVPLTAKAIEIVQRQLEGRDLTAGCGVPHSDGARCRSALVFLSPKGVPVNPRNYSQRLRIAAENARQPVRSPYTGRRAFATIAADGGLDPFAIGRLMGHAGIEVTADYVQETPAARARFLAAMGEASPLTVVGQDEGSEAGSEADLPGEGLEDLGPPGAKTGA
jgi:integrase